MINIKVIIPTILLSTSFSSHAFLNLKSSDSANDTSSTLSSLGSVVSEQLNQNVDSPIVDSLTNELNISPEQAAGGAGALLALASNSLSSSSNNELSQLIPGLSSMQNSIPGLMAMATDNDAVSGIFSSLGLDPSLISQFTPIILQYLTSQNASGGLVDSLSAIWGN